MDSSTGLSRFSSAPSMILLNSRDSIESGGNNKSGFELSFQEFEAKSQDSYGNSQHCSGLPPHYPRPSSAMESSYNLFVDHNNTQVKTVHSNLVRQSSSPAGLFAKLATQNSYSSTKELGSYGGVKGSNGELSPSTKRLKYQLSFPSRTPSSLGILSQISELDSDEPSNGKSGNGNGDDARFYSIGFPYSPWNDSSHFAESFCGMKREQGAQNGEPGNPVHMLSHYLSLPKTSAEMAAVEKLLQFQDSVPGKIRAKRGFATHPRSVAERVRRTRISERMKKLQELVPNMDKQINTADMLDLAVEYIKDLQNQFKTLSDNRANCECSRIQKPVPNQIV